MASDGDKMDVTDFAAVIKLLDFFRNAGGRFVDVVRNWRKSSNRRRNARTDLRGLLEDIKSECEKAQLTDDPRSRDDVIERITTYACCKKIKDLSTELRNEEIVVRAHRLVTEMKLLNEGHEASPFSDRRTEPAHLSEELLY